MSTYWGLTVYSCTQTYLWENWILIRIAIVSKKLAGLQILLYQLDLLLITTCNIPPEPQPTNSMRSYLKQMNPTKYLIIKRNNYLSHTIKFLTIIAPRERKGRNRIQRFNLFQRHCPMEEGTTNMTVLQFKISIYTSEKKN